MKRTLIFCQCLMLLVSISHAQIGAEAPILGKSTFGINGIAVIDVAMPTEYSYNPALITQALQLGAKIDYFEIDYGVLNFQNGPRATNSWQYYAEKVNSNSAFRLAHYSTRSKSRPIAYLGPLADIRFLGDTYELTYNQHASDIFSWGVAIVPSEKVRTELSAAGAWLGTGVAKSKIHYRLGVSYTQEKINFGFVYTYDQIDATTILSSAFTNVPSTIIIQGDFKETLWTGGVSCQPQIGTILNVNWQQGRINGANFLEKIDIKSYSFTQFLSEQLMVRIGLDDKARSISLTYFDKGWNAGASYAKDSYRKAEQYLGRADVLYLWTGKDL